MKIANVYFYLFCICIITVTNLYASSSYGDLIISKLENVYDGDTFKVTIDELHPLIGKNISVRVMGIDTPELRSKDPQVRILAYRARDYAAQLLHAAKRITLKEVRRDKYFRILAVVDIDGVCLGDELIRAGLARPYDGKTKISWE